jgi:hypothetical protein
MVRAWPTIVVGEIEYFQRLQQRETFEAFEGGRYAASAVKAREVASKASNRGYALTGATDLSSLDDHVLVAELQRRGNLVHCWSAHDFEPVLEEDEDVLELELTDEEREIAQKQAFEQACGDLDSIVISRGNEHLSDWWEQNKRVHPVAIHRGNCRWQSPTRRVKPESIKAQRASSDVPGLFWCVRGQSTLRMSIAQSELQHDGLSFWFR